MMRLVLGLGLIVSLSACDGPLSLLTGGGPNVAANVQAGATNVQSVGTTRVTEQRLVRPTARRIVQSSGDSRVSAEQVQTVNVQETPVWLILAFAVALFMDSPLRWPSQMAKLVKRVLARGN